MRKRKRKRGNVNRTIGGMMGSAEGFQGTVVVDNVRSRSDSGRRNREKAVSDVIFTLHSSRGPAATEMA